MTSPSCTESTCFLNQLITNRTLHFYPHNYGLKITWDRRIQTVLIINKPHDNFVLDGVKDLLFWLLQSSTMLKVLIKTITFNELSLDQNFSYILRRHLSSPADSSMEIISSSLKDKPFMRNSWKNYPDFQNETSRIQVIEQEFDRSTVDLVICLGGDGTLLYTSALFQEAHPPVIAFYMGSLGFLTPFEFKDLDTTLIKIFSGQSSCVNRMRLKCQINRADSSSKDFKSSNISVPGFDISALSTQFKKLPECCIDQVTPKTEDFAIHLLNEVVISRGMSPFLCDLLLTVDGKEVTNVQGDGLIISTPTGSTAYSMSAGASMIHPSVSAVLITPINPHSLSCRSIALPVNSVIEISLSPRGRGRSAHVTCDGNAGGFSLIQPGDVIRITHSPYPVPCLCSEDQVADWFSGLAQCLHWNVRHQQTEFNEARFSDVSQNHALSECISIKK